MSKFFLVVFIVILAALVAGAAWIAAWDIPAPITRVEKVIPNDRFSR